MTRSCSCSRPAANTVLFFSNLGKVYALRAYQIPEADRAAKGMFLSNLIAIADKGGSPPPLPVSKELMLAARAGEDEDEPVSEVAEVSDVEAQAMDLAPYQPETVEGADEPAEVEGVEAAAVETSADAEASVVPWLLRSGCGMRLRRFRWRNGDRIADLERNKATLKHIWQQSDGKVWNQDTLSYCHSFSSVKGYDVTRDVMGLPKLSLSASSVAAPITNYRNQGRFIEDALKQMVEVGVATTDFVPMLTTSRSAFKTGWQANAAQNKVTGWFDVPARNLRIHGSPLLLGYPVVVGLNYWGPNLARNFDRLSSCELAWCCDLDEAVLAELIPDFVEVVGADSPDAKAAAIEGFQDRAHRVLVTKPSIGGYGLNLQNAHKSVICRAVLLLGGVVPGNPALPSVRADKAR